MIRDFTEDTFNSLKELINKDSEDGEINSLQYTLDVAEEDCVVNLSEIEILVNDLSKDCLSIQDMRDGYINILNDIFDSARKTDSELSKSVLSSVDEVMNPYLESMKQLSECIDVSALGNSEEQFNYYRGKYHSTFSNSIFGNPDSFQVEIDAIEGGAYERYANKFDNFMNDKEELETLNEILHGDPTKLKPWERAALINLLNNCINCDDDGNTSLDYEKISVILSQGYEESDISVENLFEGGTHYNTTAMLEYLALAYNVYYSIKAEYNGKMDKSLFAYADLNAILSATTTYYSKVSVSEPFADDDTNPDEYEIDEVLGKYIPFGISVTEVEDSGNVKEKAICINLNQNDNEEYSIPDALKPGIYSGWEDGEYDQDKNGGNNIYIAKANVNTLDYREVLKKQNSNGKIEVDEALWNKFTGDLTDSEKDKVSDAAVEAVASKIPQTKTALEAYKTISSYVDVYKDTKEHNEQIDKANHTISQSEYLEDLEIYGNVCVNKQNTKFTSITYNNKALQEKVDYYNLVNNENLTVSDLKTAFEEYTKSDVAQSEVLSDFHKTIRDNGRTDNHNTLFDDVSYEKFKADLDDKIDKYDDGSSSYEEATDEQIEKALNDLINSYENEGTSD